MLCEKCHDIIIPPTHLSHRKYLLPPWRIFNLVPQFFRERYISHSLNMIAVLHTSYWVISFIVLYKRFKENETIICNGILSVFKNIPVIRKLDGCINFSTVCCWNDCYAPFAQVFMKDLYLKLDKKMTVNVALHILKYMNANKNEPMITKNTRYINSYTIINAYFAFMKCSILHTCINLEAINDAPCRELMITRLTGNNLL